MMKIAGLCIYLVLPQFILAQVSSADSIHGKLKPVITTISHKIGNTDVYIKTFQYGGKSDIVFIGLHDNESTGLDITKSILEERGGLLIKIENSYNRNINFILDRRSFTFDPNRMFSKTGIRQSLKSFGRSSDKAISEVDKFAKHILQLFPKDLLCAVALHDNTDGSYSVRYYQPGSRYGNDAKRVSIDASQDPDDFFLTTDSLLFYKLSARKYNTILQHNVRAKEDGSLSVYFGKNQLPYLNCEIQHGKTEQFREMIETALQCLREIHRNE